MTSLLLQFETRLLRKELNDVRQRREQAFTTLRCEWFVKFFLKCLAANYTHSFFPAQGCDSRHCR